MVFGIFPNLEKDKIFDSLRELLEILESKELPYIFPKEMKENLEEQGICIPARNYSDIPGMGEKCDVILSMGGDGSFLGTARTFCNYPVKMVGIHLGDLGFLNSMTANDMREKIDRICTGDYILESRSFLCSRLSTVSGESRCFSDVLNDIVIGHNKIGSLSRLNLWINGKHIQEYAADGIVVSTATGSTGYSLSCGGPVLSPDDTGIIVIPICAHTLQRFALVLKKTDIIQIIAPEREKELNISLDGDESQPFAPGDVLTIREAEKPIRFIRFRDQNFFSTINSKLIRKVNKNS